MQVGGLHLPLVRTVGAAGASFALLLVLHLRLPGLPVFKSALANCLAFAAGLAYTHLFEYFSHEIAMHREVRGLAFVRETHLRHHRIFHGDYFRSRNPEDLRHVTMGWYAFPILLALHYALFAAIFPVAAAPAFFFGVTVHFTLYETGHWFTHVADNRFDKVLAGIPVIRPIRAAQMRHHQIHHARPSVNFNFTPPYAGDRLAGTYLQSTV